MITAYVMKELNVKIDWIEYFIIVLSSFYESIKSNYKQGRKHNLPFWDISFIRNNENVVPLFLEKKLVNCTYNEARAHQFLDGKKDIGTIIWKSLYILLKWNYVEKRV